jgi:hypothetical protein
MVGIVQVRAAVDHDPRFGLAGAFLDVAVGRRLAAVTAVRGVDPCALLGRVAPTPGQAIHFAVGFGRWDADLGAWRGDVVVVDGKGGSIGGERGRRRRRGNEVTELVIQQGSAR